MISFEGVLLNFNIDVAEFVFGPEPEKHLLLRKKSIALSE